MSPVDRRIGLTKFHPHSPQPRLIPSEGGVSVVMPVCNEERTLRENLRRLTSWSAVREVIVVLNGCTDASESIARAAGVRQLTYPEKLGPDVGRALGAAVAKSEFILFLDADIVWRLQELQPFIRSLRDGADIALNQYPTPANRHFDHPTALAKRALNIALERPDLRAASLTAVPHAIRKSALVVMECADLAVPPVFFTKAVLAGLKISAPTYVDVSTRNRSREARGDGYLRRDVILGDHVEAFSEIIRQRGTRGGFDDLNRRREVIEALQSARDTEEIQATHIDCLGRAAVVPARNEAKTLPQVVASLKESGAEQICVIDNGSTDGTSRIARQLDVQLEVFGQALGHDVGRSVGVLATRTAVATLFVDADFFIPAKELKPFYDAVESGVDVALNDLSSGLANRGVRDAVTTVKEFLNFALQRSDLGACSLTAVPHALSGEALRVIPAAELCVPPKALVRAVISGLEVKQVQFADVIRRNPYRHRLHSRRYGVPLKKLIVGDHVEALQLLIELRGMRGGYVQPRRLEVLR